MPKCGPSINAIGLDNIFIIYLGKDALSSESLSSADSRDDFFSEGSSFSNRLTTELHIFANKPVHESASNGDTWQNGRAGKRKTP